MTGILHARPVAIAAGVGTLAASTALGQVLVDQAERIDRERIAANPDSGADMLVGLGAAGFIGGWFASSPVPKWGVGYNLLDRAGHTPAPAVRAAFAGLAAASLITAATTGFRASPLED